MSLPCPDISEFSTSGIVLMICVFLGTHLLLLGFYSVKFHATLKNGSFTCFYNLHLAFLSLSSALVFCFCASSLSPGPSSAFLLSCACSTSPLPSSPTFSLLIGHVSCFSILLVFSKNPLWVYLFPLFFKFKTFLKLLSFD